MKRTVLAVGAACVLAAPVWAEDLSEAQILVLACVEQIEKGTTWNQCLNLMFQPCVAEAVGSEGHVACLNAEREIWSQSAEALQREVSAAITAERSVELAEILGAWTGAIVQNCQEVALSKAATGQESARLGCEITEIVGLNGELAACLEGRSASAYCTFKQ